MSMLDRQVKIRQKQIERSELKAYPGRTRNRYIASYLDITPIKCRHTEAQLVVKEFVREYKHTKAVDTIVCMDGCEVIGAYLAEELTDAGIMSMNTHECVVLFSRLTDGQIIFRDNVEAMLTNKHVVLLLASATTGQTVEQSIQAIRYYGGNVQGYRRSLRL